MKRTVLGLLWLTIAAFAQTRGRVADYALVMEDAPAARTVRSRAELRGAAANAYVARIRAAQDGVIAELLRRKVAVDGADQVLANVVFVTTTPETAAQLRSLPGVAHVVYLPRLKRDLSTAVDLVNVQPAWNALGGANAGAGIKIGIIDTGIDQNHPGFQDASLQVPAGFPKGEAAYTNSKVIVARSYVTLLANSSPPSPSTSYPDDYSPRDRVGHGTAIAMIAAGVRNTGPAGTIQGIAPKAYLGNYKVFGSPGLNDYTLYSAVHQALVDAQADGMDVVTLALGEGDATLYGPLDVDPTCGDPGAVNPPCDIRAQAVESAVQLGMVVVAAAGNDGNIGIQYPALGTIHTPGTAPSAITVGATTNSHTFYQAVRVNGTSVPSGLQNINALFGDGPHPAQALTAPVRDAAFVGNDGLACTALSANSMAGAIALIAQGTCVFSDKINNAQAAGAVGAIIYQTSGSTTIYGAQNTGIPAVMIGNGDGIALKNYLAPRSDTPTVTLDPALTASNTAPNEVAAFSSRGPSIGTFANSAYVTNVIKPELAAPGVGIYTATQKLDPNGDAYHASGYTAVSGTSYSVGFVAGAVALVKQKNPGFTATQLKSAVVNTASQDVTDGGAVARVNAVGAGKLNVGDAVSVAATLDPATISFGVITSTNVSISRTLFITNVGSTAATFNFAVQQRDADSLASVHVSPTSLTLSPGTNSVTVTLSGNRPDPGSYEGFIEVTSAGQTTLRVPYLYLVGDGVPYNIYPGANGGFIGAPNDQGWLIALRLVDQFGVPVVGTKVQFRVVKGGSIDVGDSQTYLYGIAGARVNLGPSPGDQIFTGTAGGLSVEFDGYASPIPALRSQDPVLDAASFRADRGFAPGSYVAIFGSSLSDATQLEPTAALPVSLSTVSVSFDSPDGSLSLPGHVHFVTPGQVNVQIPWEFQGQTSALMKVTAGYLSSAVHTITLAPYGPGVFEYDDNGTRIAAAIDVNPADGSWYIVSQAKPARRGHILELFLNGLGPVTNQPASGEPSPEPPLARTTSVPGVTIGGLAASPDFYGLAPDIVGLYQVNVTVPNGTATGNQPLVVSIGGLDSAQSRIPVQ